MSDFPFLTPLREVLACVGCEAPAGPPAEGDVRLVPLNGTVVPTAVCDDVHFGAVELFLEGAWGRICAGSLGGDAEDFTLDAQVVCRQLGFPFGTLMDADEIFRAYEYARLDYSDPAIVWATEVWPVEQRRRLCAETLLVCLLLNISGGSFG